MKQTEISDRGLVRLLPATYHKPPSLRGLVDTDDEMEIIAEIEGLTSGRLLAERGRNPHLDPRELAWQRRSRDLRIYGDSHVNAAFTYTRAGGNRFNTEDRGAWYCAWEVMVSVSEVAWHRTRELGFTGSFHDSARYVELLADFIGIFDDLTDEPEHPALHPDPAVGYPEGQSLAQHLRRAGSTPQFGLPRRAGIASSASSPTPSRTSGRARLGILFGMGHRTTRLLPSADE